MKPTLLLFSGLPGTGKSTLAHRVAADRSWPVIGIDEVAAPVPADADYHFWDEKVRILLRLVEGHLEQGRSVVADSIFMGADRVVAQESAWRWGALFRPVHCFLSNEEEWRRRVSVRFEARGFPVASWAHVEHQRSWYAPWPAGSALTIDAIEPIEHNLALVNRFLDDPGVTLRPLILDIPNPGTFHS